MLTEVLFAVKTCLQFHNTRCMRVIILKLLKILVNFCLILYYSACCEGHLGRGC